MPKCTAKLNGKVNFSRRLRLWRWLSNAGTNKSGMEKFVGLRFTVLRLRNLRQVKCQEFGASLGYILSSRSDWTSR